MPKKRSDPMEMEIEKALRPGAFIGYRDDYPFVEQVEAAKKGIDALCHKGEAERAKASYEKAGLTAEWESTVSLVRTEHRRKGMMADFERVASGAKRVPEPSFIKMAQQRFRSR